MLQKKHSPADTLIIAQSGPFGLLISQTIKKIIFFFVKATNFTVICQSSNRKQQNYSPQFSRKYTKTSPLSSPVLDPHFSADHYTYYFTRKNSESGISSSVRHRSLPPPSAPHRHTNTLTHSSFTLSLVKNHKLVSLIFLSFVYFQLYQFCSYLYQCFLFACFGINSLHPPPISYISLSGNIDYQFEIFLLV